MEGVPTGDGRLIAEGALTWVEGPMPLRFVEEDEGGHDGAVVVGAILTVERQDGGAIFATGVIDDSLEYGSKAAYLIQNGLSNGVSIDPDEVTVEYRGPEGEPEDDAAATGESTMVLVAARIRAATLVAIPAFAEALITLDDAPTDVPADVPDEEEPEEEPVEPTAAEDRIDSFQKSEWPMFDREFAQMVKDEHPDIWDAGGNIKGDDQYEILTKIADNDGVAETEDQINALELREAWVARHYKDFRLPGVVAQMKWLAIGEQGEDAMKQVVRDEYETAAEDAAVDETAASEAVYSDSSDVSSWLSIVAAAPVTPPAEWFRDPGFAGPTKVRIDGDRILGHIATWGTCHIGFGSGQCIQPPVSHTNYAYFATGTILADDGTEFAVGTITMDGPHADKRLSGRAAAAHYDVTCFGVADVAVGEDEYGIWISGAMRPGVSDEAKRVLRASSLSGDWRSLGGNLELVAALAVNVPGFPIVETHLAASGCPEALIATGMVMGADEPSKAGPSKGVKAAADALAARIGRDAASRRQELVQRVKG
jgi:hypothetical protein